ncbi:MAG TPA: hypothetical protein DDZ21_03080 [Gammaproteobacteria bacterium]|nr:hypothetical protein [Gammaproteobacteria bacterium]
MGSAIKATRLFLAIYASLLLVPAWAQQLDIEDYQPLSIQQLKAIEVGRYPAQEARQGAAADADHIYAIVNFIIGKYDKTSGELIQRWQGARGGPIRHLNSCFAENGKLYCANSNFPEVPMASSIEVFDTETLKHSQSLSLGVLDEGSLTWFDRLDDGWLAGFAHYDADGGLSYKDHRFATINRYDNAWRRLGGWMIPESVIARMQPYAASGGAIGPDGLLYLTGHDRPEMYVLAAPAMGPKLVHIATIAIDAEGQAFAWDKSEERVVVGISRPNSEVRAFTVPEVQLPEGLKRLTEVNFSL